MTRMTGPDCAVMCNLINVHTYIHTVEGGTINTNNTATTTTDVLSVLYQYNIHASREFLFILFSPNEEGGGALPDFFFCSIFPVQQTTSGIDHRVK